MIRRPTSTMLSAVVLAVAAIVTGLSIAQAVRQHSFDPILVIAWLPAVVLAAYYRRPASGKSCSDRFLRGSRS